MFFYLNPDYDTSDRFDFSRLHEFNSDAGIFDVTNSHFETVLMKTPPMGEYIVSNGEEGRADILSHRIYGTTELWWVLLKYNKMRSPFEIQNGTKLLYPPLLTLDDTLVSVVGRQLIRRELPPPEEITVNVDLSFNYELTTYFAGYLVITPAKVIREVLPDLYYTVATSKSVDFSDVLNWSIATWTEVAGKATAETNAIGFSKVYFAIPADKFTNISITNITSDIGGGLNRFNRTVDTQTGIQEFVIFESVNYNLGSVKWNIDVSDSLET